MHFPTDEHRSSILYPFEFNAIRVHGATLHPTTFYIKVSLSPAHPLKRKPSVIEKMSEEGLQRLHFWKDTILEDIVIMDINSDIFGSMVMSVDNTTMFCPTTPTDHLLVELLHAKISSITKGFFDIHGITLSSTDTHYIEIAFRNNDGYMLPGISYFPEKALHNKPWWERDTIEVCEFAKGAVVEDELFNHFSDFFGKPKSEEADIIIFRADEDDDDKD